MRGIVCRVKVPIVPPCVILDVVQMYTRQINGYLSLKMSLFSTRVSVSVSVCVCMMTCTKVNGMNVESWCHDDVVAVLKNAGDNVLLTVKYFEPATGFLSLKGMLCSARKWRLSNFEQQRPVHPAGRDARCIMGV